MNSVNQQRRLRLRVALKLMVASALLVLLWSGLLLLLPDGNQPKRPPLRFNLAKLAVGEVIQLQWGSKRVVVLHRSAEMLAALAKRASLLRAVADESLPPGLDPSQRSRRSDYFVALAEGSDLGCPLEYRPASNERFLDEVWLGGFVDICGHSRYDLAGRVFRQQQARGNLTIPAYQIVEQQLLIE